MKANSILPDYNKSSHKLLRIVIVIIGILILVFVKGLRASGSNPDTTFKTPWWNFHFQTTVIGQYHPPFAAEYSGKNSLDTNQEMTLSVSTTLFLGCRLWEGASVYFNPELSAGGGFSSTTGIAGFPNGEVYRVSDPAPHVYIAKLYLRQLIGLSSKKILREDGLNRLRGYEPESFISINIGKFSIMDFMDINMYSHDSRTQFFNWVLMGNGAWDYPANTRGSTYGIVLELQRRTWAIRYGFVMVPTTPNGSVMDFNLWRSNSQAVEFEKKFRIKNLPGTLRIMGFLTQACMGNYKQAIQWGIEHDTTPDASYSRVPGHTKWGFGINFEQAVHENIGIFLRASWNDGQNETWAFTEVDRHLSAGISLNGGLWKRTDDILGFALMANGLSKEHRDFLKAGGYGFIIGDGNLSYSPELIAEIYYNFRFFKKYLWLSPDYQFILHPAYNSVRGPVHAIGLRVHVEF